MSDNDQDKDEVKKENGSEETPKETSDESVEAEAASSSGDGGEAAEATSTDDAASKSASFSKKDLVTPGGERSRMGLWIAVAVAVAAAPVIAGIWSNDPRDETGEAGLASNETTEQPAADAVEETIAEVEEEVTQDPAVYLAEQMNFLSQNAGVDGVTTTTSGLQYKVLTSGGGGTEQPAADDVVKVHYAGRLIDGTEFDSSIGGDPAVFPLNKVIPGWTEGLQYMSVGDTYEFYIPAELAYGSREIPGAIPANSTLIFVVELLDIPG